MKPAFVRLVLPLLFVSPPNQEPQTVVVRGRVTDAATTKGIPAANVRVIDAAISVSTDTAGM